MYLINSEHNNNNKVFEALEDDYEELSDEDKERFFIKINNNIKGFMFSSKIFSSFRSSSLNKI